MVRPEQDHPVGRAIQRLNCIAAGLGQVKVRQVRERVAQLGHEVVAGGRVIRVSEDVDVGMHRLEGLSGVA